MDLRPRTRSSRSRSSTPFVLTSLESDILEESHVEQSVSKSIRRTTTATVRSGNGSSTFDSINEEYHTTGHVVKPSTSSKRLTRSAKMYKTSDYSSEEGDNEVSSTRSISENEKNRILEDAKRSAGSSDGGITALGLYRRAKRYWDEYPKTDWTYSPFSKDRVEIAPGVVAMPNMSRRHLSSYDKYTNTEKGFFSSSSSSLSSNIRPQNLFGQKITSSSSSSSSSSNIFTRFATKILVSIIMIVVGTVYLFFRTLIFGYRSVHSVCLRLAKGLHRLTSRVMLADTWLLRKRTAGGKTASLMALCLVPLVIFAATQDIAVDGWALTMLSKDNVGHSSACNSVGQTAGFFLSYVLFMALESASFCNMYLRWEPRDEGMVTLPGFLYFWGWVFLITTTVVAIFKKEEEPTDGEHEIVYNTDINKAYSCLKKILGLRSIQILSMILLTSKIGFSATDSVMSLKLVEAGIPKERLGLLAVPMIPVQIAMPLVIAKYTTGPRPLDVFIKAMPYRLMFGFVAAFLVWITPYFVPNSAQGLPILYVMLLLICYVIHQVCVYCMFVSVMAFFAKVSDSSVGGTYMTLLNTLCNLGGNWPSILALYFVDPLTWKQCVGGTEGFDNTCRNSTERDLCLSKGGRCDTILDGFYIEILICAVIGFLWLSWGRKKIDYIQNLDDYAWRLSKRRR